MKSADDVLRQKEADLARVRHEIDNLKIVAALLADDDSDVDQLNHSSNGAGGNLLISEEEAIGAPAEATGTDGLSSSVSHHRPKRWNVLKRHS
jgi:hypothetical protein